MTAYPRAEAAGVEKRQGTKSRDWDEGGAAGAMGILPLANPPHLRCSAAPSASLTVPRFDLFAMRGTSSFGVIWVLTVLTVRMMGWIDVPVSCAV